MRVSILFASAAIAVAAPASAATVLFSQNFDALPEGIPAGSIPGFVTTGTVDVVTSGNFSIDCVGNTGKCLDIDGTPGPGALTTNSIAYAAGRQLTLSFAVSGNQRNDTADDFQWTFNLAAPSNIFGWNCTSGFLNCPAPGNYFNITSPGFYTETILGSRAWVTYSVVFTPSTAGSLTMTFRSPSVDFIGPVLDDVLVTQAIPEPASWAMLIAGFGLVGAARRRQRLATV